MSNFVVVSHNVETAITLNAFMFLKLLSNASGLRFIDQKCRRYTQIEGM